MRLLAPRDAGRLLSLSVARVQQLSREGRLRTIRDSANRRLFREADVLKLKAAREQAKAVPASRVGRQERSQAAHAGPA